MKYYAMFYEVVDDFVARRAPYREEHLRLVAEAHTRGELVLAGALAEPADRALLIFLVPEEGRVVAFAQNDPYVKHGLVRKYEIRPWTVVTENARKEAPKAPARGSVLRRWTARTTKSQLPQYVQHFQKIVLPQLRQFDGYLGATLYSRAIAQEVELVVATYWVSREAITQFAGPELEKAVVADEAVDVTTDYDRKVQHFEVVIAERV